MNVFLCFIVGCVIGAIGVFVCFVLGVECPAGVGSLIKFGARSALHRLGYADVPSMWSSGPAMPSDSSSFCFVPPSASGVGHSAASYRNCGGSEFPLMTQRHRSSYVTDSGLTSERLTAMCQLAVCHEDEEDYVVRSCRLVLLDSCMVLYEVLSSRSIGSHERAVTNERLIGRIRLGQVMSRSIFVNSADKRSARTGGLHGHMLMLTTHSGGGRSLFEAEDGNFGVDDSDPLLGATARDREWWGSGGKAVQEVLLGRRKGSSFGGAGRRGELFDSLNRHTPVVGQGDNVFTKFGAAGRSWDCDGGAEGKYSDAGELPRTFVFLKFRYSREQERVHNLLTGMEEATQWHKYLQTIPTPNAFNVLLSRIIFQSLRSTALANLIREKVQKTLDATAVLKFPRELEGRILLDDVALTAEVPVVSNVTDPIVLAKGEMVFDLDLLYRGGASLLFRFCLSYRGVRIPHVTLCVKVARVVARLRVSIGPPPSKVYWVGFLAPPDVQLKVKQGVESGRGVLHRLLTSLPDLSRIATKLFKLYLLHEMMLPLMDDFPLPNVEDSPPVTPRSGGKKPWNVPFSKEEAIRRSREHLKQHQC